MIISLLLLVLMAVGFLQLIGTVRALFALFGRRWTDAKRLARNALLVAVFLYPLITAALYYVQLHWAPPAAAEASSPAEALGRTISATLNFGVVGVLTLPFAALAWLVAAVARLRGAQDLSGQD